jgi:hypothetical protein
MVVDMEKRLTSVEGDDNHRIDTQRDRITKLETRITQLECGKHEYKYSGREDCNQLRSIYRLMPGFLLPDYRYVFTCTECLKRVEKREKNLTAPERSALVKLGLLEKKA